MTDHRPPTPDELRAARDPDFAGLAARTADLFDRARAKRIADARLIAHDSMTYTLEPIEVPKLNEGDVLQVMNHRGEVIGTATVGRRIERDESFDLRFEIQSPPPRPDDDLVGMFCGFDMGEGDSCQLDPGHDGQHS